MATQVQLRRGTTAENDAFTGAQGELTFDTNNKRVRVHDGGTAGGFEIITEDANGNVGIGTASPTEQIHIENSSSAGLRIKSTGSDSNFLIQSNDGALSSIFFGDVSDQSRGLIRYDNATENMFFSVNNMQEAARIDSSGNLLVGKTSSAFGTAGVESSASGGIWSTRSVFQPASFNLLTNDGPIAAFYKDSALVGSIGTSGGTLTVINSDIGLKFNGGLDAVYSCNGSGATVTDTVDLGVAGSRFKDLYLSGGVLLGGTGSANKLDDYEEGTFTPNLPNITLGNGTSSGLYTKVGSLVHAQLLFIMGSTTSFGGSFFCDNLPFAASGTLSNQYGLTGNLLDSGSDNFMAYARVSDNTSNGLVFYPESGSSGAPNGERQPLATAPFTWAVNDKIEVGFLYYTDA